MVDPWDAWLQKPTRGPLDEQELIEASRPDLPFSTDDVSMLASGVKGLELLLNPPSKRWQVDPVAWVDERLNLHLWSKEREILESVRDNHDTAVRSCHDVGKSFTAACAACWWLDVWPPGDAFVVTTAPTGHQVKAILWREIGRMHKRGGLAGRTNLTEWYIGDEIVAFGRKPSDYEPTAFQGIHAPHVLVILDEACGIPKTLWDAASTLTANDGSRTLAIGNPDDPHSEFASVCKPGSGWSTIHIGWKHTPNATGEDVPDALRSILISERWVEGRKSRWGEDSSLYQSKVLGEFPVDADDGVVPSSWISRCRYNELPETTPHDAGLDVGAGGDRTVLRERRGPRAGRELSLVDKDPMRQVGKLVEAINEWEVTRVKVDVIGVGWALAGRLEELSSKHNPSGERTHAAEIVGVNFAEASAQPTRFLNLRAEVYWEVGRELSRLQSWDLSQIDDDIAVELAASRYVIVDSRGKIKIEPKDEVRKRLGASPDRAEALLLAFYEPGTGATVASTSLYVASSYDAANAMGMGSTHNR